ncbi:SDR family oxidoreductase [Sphingobium sp. WCS2017Hpa-17]|uniref:SDR family NAD(P)-dependent oxidoreductase n=1 Tax=Sphingobium sp. WCS2017Hpa-17 TaxID=3073638 RepID=UPI002889AF1A|nr:SDR family oxidoreductase [Sphingobium sp. WCS2017Hpa-17]
MAEAMFPKGACLVFGGSGGIGRAVALGMAEAGSDIGIVYRSKRDAAEAAAADIERLGRRATVHVVDVRIAEQVQFVIDSAIADHGRLHTIIWAAGPVVDQRFLADVTQEQWKLAVDVELHGFFNVVQATLPHLRSQGGGSYVTLGSAGHLRWPDRDVLSVAPKGTNEQIVRALAREEGRFEVRANSILVGVIEAGMFRELTERGELDPQWAEDTRKMLALKRWGRAADIANAAVFLASDKAAYVTGQQLAVAGGFQL